MQSSHHVEIASRVPTPADITNIHTVIINNTDVIPLLNAKDFNIQTLIEFSDFARQHGFFSVADFIGDKIAFELMIEAAKRGDSAFHETFVLNIVDKNKLFQTDAYNMTALHWATQGGQLFIVKILLKIFKDNCDAVIKSKIEIWDLIILALKNNHKEIADYFLADCTSSKELEVIVANLLRLSLQHPDESFHSNLKLLIVYWMQIPLDVNTVVAATRINDIPAVYNYLAKHGCKHINISDEYGESLLERSALHGNINIIHLILGNNLYNEINEEIYENALFGAAKYGHYNVVCSLLPNVKSIEIIQKVLDKLRDIQNLSYSQGLTGNIYIRIPNSNQEPNLADSKKIKKTYPIAINYLLNRLKELQNNFYIFYDFIVAIKGDDLAYVEAYIQHKIELKDNSAAESAIKIGLIISIIKYQTNLKVTDNTNPIINYFVNKTKNPEDLRYVYQSFTQTQKQELPVPKVLHESLLNFEPNSLITYEERIEILKAADYEIEVPADYICPISRGVKQQPISIGRNCKYVQSYDLISLIKYFITQENVPSTIDDPLTKTPIPLNELMNGVDIILKNRIDEFVCTHEKIHADIIKAQAVRNKRQRGDRDIRTFFSASAKRTKSSDDATKSAETTKAVSENGQVPVVNISPA